MNVLNLSSEKANYVPTWVNPTAVSGAGSNPHGATALEIATSIVGRKTFAAIPIELHVGIQEAQQNGNTAMASRLQDSANNAVGSTLLRLQSEAEEGSLLHKLTSERLDAWKKEFGEPIPNYNPIIPQISTKIVKMTMDEDTRPYAEKAAAQNAAFHQNANETTSNPQQLTQQAKMTMMSSWLKQFEINNGFFSMDANSEQRIWEEIK